jgi:hypothetical protein
MRKPEGCEETAQPMDCSRDGPVACLEDVQELIPVTQIVNYIENLIGYFSKIFFLGGLLLRIIIIVFGPILVI